VRLIVGYSLSKFVDKLTEPRSGLFLSRLLTEKSSVSHPLFKKKDKNTDSKSKYSVFQIDISEKTDEMRGKVDLLEPKIVS